MLNYPFVYPSAKENATRGLQEPRRGALPAGRREPSVGAAARRDQSRRLQLLRATRRRPSTRSSAWIAPRRPTRSTIANGGRVAGRSPRASTTRRRSMDVYPGFADPDPQVDRAGGAAPGHRPAYQPDLSLARSSPHDPPRSTTSRPMTVGTDRPPELRDNVQDRPERGGTALMEAAARPLPPPRPSAGDEKPKKPPITERARSERRLGWMLCAPGGGGDAARHRLPDQVRVDCPSRPRPAQPRRARVRRPRQLRGRAAPEPLGPTSPPPWG